MALICRHCEAPNLEGATHCSTCGDARLSSHVAPVLRRPMLLLAISSPLWIPVVYLPLVFWESHFIRNGPLDTAALPLIFIVPAVGAIPILHSPGIHSVIK